MRKTGVDSCYWCRNWLAGIHFRVILDLLECVGMKWQDASLPGQNIYSPPSFIYGYYWREISDSESVGCHRMPFWFLFFRSLDVNWEPNIGFLLTSFQMSQDCLLPLCCRILILSSVLLRCAASSWSTSCSRSKSFSQITTSSIRILWLQVFHQKFC